MATPPRQPQRISKRVLYKWEQLVYRKKMAAERKAAEEPQGLGAGAASNTTVPQTLVQQAEIESILQTADELAKKSPAVARILCEYAYTLVQGLDPNSEGRGVLQFKTGLLSVIKQKRSKKEGEKIDRSHDVQILQEFYQRYREQNHLEQLEYEDNKRRHSDSYDEDSTTTEQRAEVQRKMYLIARILNEVVDALTKDGQTEEFDSDLKRTMEEDAKKVKGFKAYNILPLETPGVANVFQSFPEVGGAAKVLWYNESELPNFPEDSGTGDLDRHLDLFDFLEYAFGFQADNVANQREHLILLLSNSQSRLRVMLDTEEKVLQVPIRSSCSSIWLLRR